MKTAKHRYHRLPTFSSGKLFSRDLDDSAFTKIVFKSDEINKTFERLNAYHYLDNGESVRVKDILILLNYAGKLYGVDVAIVELYVNDPFIPNPWTKVPQHFKYGIIYHNQEKTSKKNKNNTNKL